MLGAALFGPCVWRGPQRRRLDAATDGDLTSIARVAGCHFPDALLAGSAGLASAVARRMALETGRREHRTAPRLESPLLVVSGSWNPMALLQIDELSNVSSLDVVAVETEDVIVSRAHLEAHIEAVSAQVKHALRKGRDVALSLRPPSAGFAMSRYDTVVVFSQQVHDFRWKFKTQFPQII